MIPIKLAFDLLTTPPPMSQCHQYNFTAGTAHSDNNMLAPIVPRVPEEVPPSPSVFVHGPHQVWELGGFLLVTCRLPLDRRLKGEGRLLPKKTRVWNKDYLSLVSINGRGKDHSPNGLGDDFQDLWYNDMVQAQAIRALFLVESNQFR
jgi:hypothetical protein